RDRRRRLVATTALIDKLEFLLALARERHFGRAAEACGVTQPTLSAGVKQLEDAMGVLLVNRGSRFRSFTPEGERVLDWARRIVGDARAMRQELDALRHGLTGRWRVAAIPTTLAMGASLTTPFRMRHPNVQFTILSRTSIEVLAELENLEIDAGVTYLDNEPLGRVNAFPLYREHYRLLTSSDAPFGNRATVTWAEVAKGPLCLLTPDMQNRRLIDELLRPAAARARRPSQGRAFRARAPRPRGERDAGKARGDAGANRAHPRHSHRRAAGRAHHRARRSRARADDAADRGAGGGGAAARAAARRRGRAARAAGAGGGVGARFPCVFFLYTPQPPLHLKQI